MTLIQRLRRVNYARLNHILIPAKKDDRDRFRKRISGRTLGIFFWFFLALSAEGRSLFALAFLIGSASADIGDSNTYLLFSAIVGLLASALAIRPFYGLSDFKLEVNAPSRVSAFSRQIFSVSLINQGVRDVASLRLSRPFLPWDGKWDPNLLGAPLVKAGERVQLETSAVFVERGEHHIDSFEVGRLTPFGLAVGKHVLSSGIRFLVVPRIAPVSRVDLPREGETRGRARRTKNLAGDEEMTGVRPYVHGDPLKQLHVRTWARTGVPHVRQLVAEQSEGVLLVIALDGSDAAETVIEGAISLAAGVASSLTSGAQGISAVLLGDSLVRLEPKRGRAALDRVLDLLAKLEVQVGAKKRIEEPTRSIDSALSSISSAVIVAPDASPEREEIADRLRERGVPTKLLRVGGEADGGVPLSRIQAEVPFTC